MSGEQFTAKEPINTSDIQLLKNSNTASRVNINDLLLKLKYEEKKEHIIARLRNNCLKRLSKFKVPVKFVFHTKNNLHNFRFKKIRHAGDI